MARFIRSTIALKHALQFTQSAVPVISRRGMATALKPAISVDFAGVSQAKASEAEVNITFVNYAGARVTLPGRIGDSLYDAARRSKYEYLDAGCGGGGSPQEQLHKEGQWYEPKYGEGAGCYYCHVIIPKSHYELLPPKRPDEVDCLRLYPFPEDMTETSRLACQVKITKEMEGMVVYIPDGPPSDFP